MAYNESKVVSDFFLQFRNQSVVYYKCNINNQPYANFIVQIIESSDDIDYLNTKYNKQLDRDVYFLKDQTNLVAV